MVASATQNEQTTGVELRATPAGFTVEITHAFPLSDLDVFVSVRTPQRVRTLLDTDGDRVADHVFETPLKFCDADGDGVITRDSGDLLVLEPDNATVIQPGVALDCGPEERRAVAERIVGQLSGAGRSFAGNLDKRR